MPRKMKLNKNARDILSISTCGLSFIAGWGLTIAGFIVPPTGEISSSVLWVLGQALLYCAAVIGIDTKLKGMKDEIEKHLNDKPKK